jgi:hypothetical protein
MKEEGNCLTNSETRFQYKIRRIKQFFYGLKYLTPMAIYNRKRWEKKMKDCGMIK